MKIVLLGYGPVANRVFKNILKSDQLPPDIEIVGIVSYKNNPALQLDFLGKNKRNQI